MSSGMWKVIVGSVLCVVAMWGLSGCSTLSGEDEGDAEALQDAAQSFHTNLRWARYDHARDQVHDSYRPTFDGVFEERGDDYEIVDMRLKRADIVDPGKEAHIQVQQQWYVLPSTTVENERFIERWVFEEGRWWMRERMQRADFREQGELFDSQLDDEPVESEGER